MNYRIILVAIAQTLCFFIAGISIPLLGQIIALFTPVPLILAYVRTGQREGTIALLGASAVMGALSGWQSALVLFCSFGLIALGVGEGMRRNLKPEQTSLLGGFLPIAVLGMITAFYIARIGANPIQLVEEYLRESVAVASKTYIEYGLSDMATTINAISDSFVHSLARLIPGIVIATSVMQAACCYGIARSIIMRKNDGSEVQASPPLSLWHAPDSWVWGLIVSLALVAVPQETVRFTGWNLAILFAVVYLSQGTAIVEYYLRKSHINTFMRGLILALILAMPSIVFVIALGIVDVWADVRKVREPMLPQG